MWWYSALFSLLSHFVVGQDVITTTTNPQAITLVTLTTELWSSGRATATVTAFIIIFSPTSTTSTPSSTNSQLGAIIGIAVGGGIAIIGIIAFFVWMFTRKRSELDIDDSSHPLPMKNTYRPVAPLNMDMMMSDSGTSGSGAHRSGISTGEKPSQRQQRKGSIPQLERADLQETLSAPAMPRLQPERQTERHFRSLRRDIETLRMEMDAIRAGQHQQSITEELPPGYASAES